MTSAGIYVRISDDQAGKGLGVERQELDCRKAAKARGWDVARVYCDNDVSAYKRGVYRPAFEEMLGDLDTGKIDALLVYDLDRLARQPRDLERAIDLFEVRPLLFGTVQADIDLGSADGRTMARVSVAFANKSSADTSRRVARKHLELAQKGIPVGPRPFGWDVDKTTLKSDESRLIRQGALDLLAGRSLGKLTDEWNAAGYLTSRGNPWQRQTMRQMYLSPRMAGYRVYRREILLDDAGQPVQGTWQAILDVETWEKLRTRLSPPTAAKGQRPGGRRYMLSGIARCALCGTLLRGNAAAGKGFTMACPPPNQRGCGQVTVSGPRMDGIIEALVLKHLGTETAAVEPDLLNQEEITEKSARIRELMTAYLSRDLSGAVVIPAVKALEAEVAVLEDMDRQVKARQRATTTPPEAWGDLDTDQRREIVSACLSAVLVRPARTKGGRFDPDRVEPVWR